MPVPKSMAKWSTLSIRQACEAMTADHCRGVYGLSIDAAGSYVIGPNESGKTIRGQIKAEELRAIRNDLEPLLLAYAKGAARMCPQRSVPGGGTDVVVRTSAGKEAVLKDAFQAYCGPQEEAADDLLSRLRGLLESAYPIPF